MTVDNTQAKKKMLLAKDVFTCRLNLRTSTVNLFYQQKLFYYVVTEASHSGVKTKSLEISTINQRTSGLNEIKISSIKPLSTTLFGYIT